LAGASARRHIGPVPLLRQGNRAVRWGRQGGETNGMSLGDSADIMDGSTTIPSAGAPEPVGAGAPVGIGGAADASPGGLADCCSRPVSRGFSTLPEGLSVRTDWSSQDDFSPMRSTATSADPNRPAPETPLEAFPSSQRTRTLTSTVSPRMSKNTLRYGVHSIQNMRQEMEDAHRAVLGMEGQSPSSRLEGSAEDAGLGSFSYFAIFDGHGGARAAEFAGERLHSLLASDAALFRADPAEALRGAFAQTEAEWLAVAGEQDLMDGTTAAVALVDRAAGVCVVGNVGDSEVIMGTCDSSGRRSFQVLTEVHHAKRSASEAERVTALGGRIWHGRLGHPKISPQVLSLSVSRAIGDLMFKDDKYTGGKASGLTAQPYINVVQVLPADVAHQFLVIGCDGLWDTVTYSQASDFVFARLADNGDPQTISEALVRLARDAGSNDNITVMVVVP